MKDFTKNFSWKHVISYLQTVDPILLLNHVEFSPKYLYLQFYVCSTYFLPTCKLIFPLDAVLQQKIVLVILNVNPHLSTIFEKRSKCNKHSDWLIWKKPSDWWLLKWSRLLKLDGHQIWIVVDCWCGSGLLMQMAIWTEIVKLWQSQRAISHWWPSVESNLDRMAIRWLWQQSI